MRGVVSSLARPALIGAAIALPILGAGGRIIMRIIAHWEGRAPVFTVGGTSRVLFFATMAGLAAGIVHGLAKRFIHNALIRNVLFGAFCIAFTWRAVNALLPRPRLLFVALTIVYVIILELTSANAPDEMSATTEPAPSNS